VTWQVGTPRAIVETTARVSCSLAGIPLSRGVSIILWGIDEYAHYILIGLNDRKIWVWIDDLSEVAEWNYMLEDVKLPPRKKYLGGRS